MRTGCRRFLPSAMPPRRAPRFTPPFRPRKTVPGDAKRAALAAWRGVDLAPIERERELAARPVNEVLTAALKRIQFE